MSDVQYSCSYSYEEEIVEEEIIEESNGGTGDDDDDDGSIDAADFQASIKVSTQKELLGRKMAGQPTTRPIIPEAGAVLDSPRIIVEEEGSASVYEEQEIENSFARYSMDSTFTLESASAYSYYTETEIVETEHDEDETNDEDLLYAFRERQKSEAATGRTCQDQVDERSVASDESEYEEQVIEKWFGRDDVPEDLEAACRALIPIVYKGDESVCAETMMRRTPLKELYRYLRQHYLYKKEVKHELMEEEEEETPEQKQTGLQDLLEARWRKSRYQNATEAGVLSASGRSNMHAPSHEQDSEKNGEGKASGTSFEWSTEQLVGGSESKLVLAEDLSLMGESERTLEEFIFENETDSFDVEETIHEGSEAASSVEIIPDQYEIPLPLPGNGEDDDESETGAESAGDDSDIIEETVRDEDDDVDLDETDFFEEEVLLSDHRLSF